MPLNLSPKTLRLIGEFFFDGFNDDDVSFYFQIPKDIVAELRQGKLQIQCRRVLIEKKSRLIRKLRDTKRFNAGAVWFLERRYPQEFSKPETQLGFAAGSVTNNTLVVSAEAAQALLTRSKPLDEELDKLLAERALASSSSMAPDEPSLTSTRQDLPQTLDKLAGLSNVDRQEGIGAGSRERSEQGERDSLAQVAASEASKADEPEGGPLPPVPPEVARAPALPSSGENSKKSTFSVKKKRGRPKKKV
jgi:hypothetical protein